MKPRTPADIGRDIARAEQRIRDLKSELSDVPPSVLELTSTSAARTYTFAPGYAGFAITRETSPGNDFNTGEASKLRDWLNYYFPKEA